MNRRRRYVVLWNGAPAYQSCAGGRLFTSNPAESYADMRRHTFGGTLFLSLQDAREAIYRTYDVHRNTPEQNFPDLKLAIVYEQPLAPNDERRPNLTHI